MFGPRNSQLLEKLWTIRTWLPRRVLRQSIVNDSIFSKIAGSTLGPVFLSAQDAYNKGYRTNGYYRVRPAGVTESFSVFCDLDGTESGIGTGGWMRVEYSADKFTQDNPWTETGDSNISDGTPYSGDFTFSHTLDQIDAMKASATEIRQTFQSYGYGSVGWTFSTGAHFGCKTLDGSVWIGAGDPSIPTNTDYSFVGWDANGVLEPRGTDPTDANDLVWRESLIYLIESGNTYLPIQGVYVQDVDLPSERRYFPLSSIYNTIYCIQIYLYCISIQYK